MTPADLIARREALAALPTVKRVEVIGGQTLILGDCLDVMPVLGRFDHVISDPPYEQSSHDSKNSLRGPTRIDAGPELHGLNFAGIDGIRDAVTGAVSALCGGWFIAFCTIEGVARWADCINASTLKYKRGCIWVKPDSTPQLNGQGPAHGAECFVTAWGGKGHAKWNAGGKRGVYRHNVNQSDRHGAHPTEKPWRLFSELLTDFTNYGDTILDPFMGSGTTLVACQKTGRAGTGIEIDPEYWSIACERVHKAWQEPDMFIEQAAPKAQQMGMFDV